MSFFSQFPKIKYDIENNGISNDIIDIFRNVDVRDSRIDDITTYNYYEILEGERPDVISDRLYGTPDYYWTFFVINEKLKDGLASWPRSYRQIELMFNREFEGYSILVFIPDQWPVARKYEKNFEMLNYFGGLDLLNKYLRVVPSDKSLKAEAKIQKFDDHRFQMWVKDIDSTNIFKSNLRWSIKYIENPFVAGTEYAAFEEERTAWAKDALKWTKLNYTTIYYEFINDLQFKQGLALGSNAYYRYFLEKYFANIVFTSHRFYEEAFNAPSYFLDTDVETDKSSPFNAYDHVYHDSLINLENGYIVGQSDFNVSAAIKEDGYDQSAYEDYGDIARNRRYIPSFVKHYTAREAKYVSYAEDIKEREFEARKIRIIRPELIDQFVEIYQDKISK